MIDVMITDDHPLAIAGLQNMLAPFPHIRVMGGYTSGNALLENLPNTQPHVLLLDVLLPGKKGSELAAIVSQSWPAINIIAFTSLDAPTHVKSMMRSGCKGYLLKNAGQDILVQAIETVYRGEEFIEPGLKDQLLQNVLKYKKPLPAQRSRHTPALTRREKQILELIVQELSNQQIADKLFLSLRTVENHRFNLQQKLDVKNSVGLVKAALQMGLLE